MKIAIHRDPGFPDAYTHAWAECLQARGVHTRWVDLRTREALQKIATCDGVMWHWGHEDRDQEINRVLNVIELQMGIPVFPNHRSSWHRRDKLSQYYLLQAAGAPMPKTWVFWDRQRAREWAQQTDYPKVFKLSPSHSGKDVLLAVSEKMSSRLIDRMFGPGIYPGQIERSFRRRDFGGNRRWRALVRRSEAALRYVARLRPPLPRPPERGYAYFQEFVPETDHKVGISVVGDRAIGYRAFNASGKFGSHVRGYDYDQSGIDVNCVRLAFDISSRLNFPMMAYDMLIHHSEPVVLELEFRNHWTSGMPGHWNRDLEWVGTAMTPQEAQVEAFLKDIRSGNERSAPPTMPLP